MPYVRIHRDSLLFCEEKIMFRTIFVFCDRVIHTFGWPDSWQEKDEAMNEWGTYPLVSACAYRIAFIHKVVYDSRFT